MFDNLVAGVLTVVLDDQTDRDVITLASELVSIASAPPPRHGQARPRLARPADAAKCR